MIHVNNFGDVTGTNTAFKISTIEADLDTASVSVTFGNQQNTIGKLSCWYFILDRTNIVGLYQFVILSYFFLEEIK